MISPKRILATSYRETFSRDSQSIRVFEDILTDLCLYETLETEEERYLHNFAIRLLAKMGIYDPPNINAVTRNLLSIELAAPTVIPESGPRDVKREELKWL